MTIDKTILVIDDEAFIRNIINKIFCKEYKLFFAEEGREGLSILEKEDIDLIFTDFMYGHGDLNGHTFADISKDKYPDKPVVVITGVLYSDDFKRQPNVNYYLAKPFELKDIRGIAKKYLK